MGYASTWFWVSPWGRMVLSQNTHPIKEDPFKIRLFDRLAKLVAILYCYIWSLSTKLEGQTWACLGLIHLTYHWKPSLSYLDFCPLPEPTAKVVALFLIVKWGSFSSSPLLNFLATGSIFGQSNDALFINETVGFGSIRWSFNALIRPPQPFSIWPPFWPSFFSLNLGDCDSVSQGCFSGQKGAFFRPN